jgi:hypothetical protein
MEQTKAEVQAAYRQVGAAIASLDTLMGAQAGDLRPLYKDLAAQNKLLRESAGLAQDRAQTLKARNATYFTTWAQEIELIQDASLRQQSLARYQASQANYQALEQSMFRTRDAYVPLIKTLNDLETALGADLTANGIATLKPYHQKAREQAIALQRVMKESMGRIDAAAGQLAPQAAGGSM